MHKLEIPLPKCTKSAFWRLLHALSWLAFGSPSLYTNFSKSTTARHDGSGGPCCGNGRRERSELVGEPDRSGRRDSPVHGSRPGETQLDAQGIAWLEEDLRSPCTEEIAVFSAFARTVAEGERGFVVLDTAPTGHTILLLDAAEAYHRDVTRTMSDVPDASMLKNPRRPEIPKRRAPQPVC